MPRILAVSIALLAALALAGCGQPWDDIDVGGPNSLGIEFPAIDDDPPLGAVVFFIDGVRADWFEQMLDAGELPAFRSLADRGLYAPRAVVGVPSVTLPGVVSFLTARCPGGHGVTGVNWFDRTRLIFRNYEDTKQMPQTNRDFTDPTVFEALAGRFTHTIMLQADRGASAPLGGWTMVPQISYHFGRYEFIDRITMQHWHELARVARRRGRFPALTVVYVCAPDFVAHADGLETGRYRDAIRHADRQIGRVLGDLRRARLLDRVLVGAFSDHGMQQTSQHLPLRHWLADEVGLNVTDLQINESKDFDDRMEEYQQYAAVVAACGDRYAALHLRRPKRDAAGRAMGFEPWPLHPSADDLAGYPIRDGAADLLSLLAGHPAIDAIAWPIGPDTVRLRRAAGEVEFTRKAGAIAYRVIDGDDPLGWKGKVSAELLAGMPADGRRWLAETHRTNYPDLPEQLLAYFDAHRAGDIAVFASPGWDFHGPYKAGHGGLDPADMHAPLLLAGPGVPHVRPEAVRMIDLPATLLQLLDAPVPQDVDGTGLFEK